MKAPSETSYLSSFIPPLGPLWVLLMGLQRYIIYVTASDTSPLAQNPGPRRCTFTSSNSQVCLSPPQPMHRLPHDSIFFPSPLVCKDAWMISAMDSNGFNLQK